MALLLAASTGCAFTSICCGSIAEDGIPKADPPGWHRVFADEDEFRRHAESAKQNCPVSKALAGVQISVDATLVEA